MPPVPTVREGGVEPPRPCGHWNLNPARLPIPPPAHWVCPGCLPLGGWRLPTPRTLARWKGWVHIPCPRRQTPHRTFDVPATYQPVPVHVSTSYRYPPSPQEGVGVHSQVRDTGLRPPLRSMQAYRRRLRAAVPPEEFEEELHRELRHASTPVGRADRGNQPIDRRVDTISKQYQQNPASGPQGSTQDGSQGGGAPWES